ALLRAPSTSFVLVASPHAISVSDAAFLRDDLALRDVRLDAIVFNQAFVAEPSRPREPVQPVSESSHPSKPVRAIRHTFVQQNDARAAVMRDFLKGCSADVTALAIAEADKDIHDLDGLRQLLRAGYPLSP